MKKKEAESEKIVEEPKRYSMFLTVGFANRLDKLKSKKGFKHRSDIIIHLLNIALDFLENKERDGN